MKSLKQLIKDKEHFIWVESKRWDVLDFLANFLPDINVERHLYMYGNIYNLRVLTGISVADSLGIQINEEYYI